jgi:exodeoxyribonuclease VII large subunit
MTEIDVSSVGIDCDSVVESNIPPVPNLTLRAFVEEAGRAIRQTLPREAWVDAVVLDARQTRHGLSLELVEPNVENTSNSAFLRAFLGKSEIAAIQNDIGLELDCDALKGAHAHLQGRVNGVDPTLVESLIAKRIQTIRRLLTDEGILRAQSALSPPAEITQIAVVHPENSAGWADISAELRRLENAGLLQVHSFPATFEGPQAAPTLTRALAEAATQANQGGLDLLLIIRGGGAKAGLAELANLGIARAICRMPVPVVTGLGHASDRSLLDEVAWRAADTPSKALGLVKSILRQRAEGARISHKSIVTSLDRMLEQNLRPQLSAERATVVHAFQQKASGASERLRNLWFSVQEHLLRFHSDLEHIEDDLRREAVSLLSSAGGLPSRIGPRAERLYGTIMAGSQVRWRVLAAGSPVLQPSLDATEAFLTRQAKELERLVTQVEISARRRLSDEFNRLMQQSNSVSAVGLEGTLARGFALPLNPERRIIKTADALRSLHSFELLFRDGSVACRPVALD